MYKLLTLESTVRVPPKRFGKNLKKVVLDILRKSYEGMWDKDLGLILVVNDVKEIGVGKIIPGDGAPYHKVIYEAVTYVPVLHELVEGIVVEVLEFGVFTRIGPIDGLVHVSQVTNDFINFDAKQRILVAKETKRILREGDLVRARIVTLSIKRDAVKIGLTMRQPGLGKIEWIMEEKEEVK